MKFIATFTLKSKRACVTDPCYERGTWCSGTVGPVKKGVWQGYVAMHDADDWGIRTDKLIALHEDLKGDMSGTWEAEGFQVGVDSGQAGIFDFDKYPEDEGERDAWREKIFNATDANQYCAAVCEFGLASSSGLGDGAYICYTLRRDNVVVGIMIDYGTGIPLRAIQKVQKKTGAPLSGLLDQETRIQTLAKYKETLPLLLKIDKDLNAEIETALKSKPVKKTESGPKDYGPSTIHDFQKGGK